MTAVLQRFCPHFLLSVVTVKMECRVRVMYGFFVSDEMMVATKEGNNACGIFQQIDADEEGVMF